MNCVLEYLNSSVCKSDRTAVIFYDGNKSLENPNLRCSFSELTELAEKCANYLDSKNIQKGDKIILFERPTPGLYGFIIGALARGVKLMIIEPWMPGAHFDYIIKKHRPKAILSGLIGRGVLLKSKEVSQIPVRLTIKEMNQYRAIKLKIEDVKNEDEAILTFTSGSYGSPKGVHRKHGYLIDQRSTLKKYLHYDNLEKLDLTVFTNLVLLNLILGKGSLVLDSKWKMKMIQDLDRLPADIQVDTIATGPKFLELLIDHTKSLELKSFHIGGALGDINLYERAIKRWDKGSFTHVYGSTEAEPVSFCDLKKSIQKSKEKNYFQALYLGQPVEEVEIMQRGKTLWVSGAHVSPMYENDPIANEKNKWNDENGKVWHNMGDQIFQEEDGLWYKGRDFQEATEFDLEQSVYSLIKKTTSFVKKNDDSFHLYGELNDDEISNVMRAFPEINEVTKLKIIRDPRHRARIDRDKSLKKGLYMKNIMQFMKERVPVVANLILAVGMILSVAATMGIVPDLKESIFIGISLIIFITELRFMDELKDYDKDKIAHPDRPLPRGLVTKNQVNFLIKFSYALLLLCVAFSYMFFSLMAGHYLLVTSVWLFLMYNEFFLGESLSRSPILYAITHQVIIIPACLFAFAVFGQDSLTTNSIGFCLLVLSSFFTFEVGRKMDPESNPILGTYLVHYGKMKTNLLITVLAAIGLYGTVILGKLWWWGMIPFSLTVLTQARIWFQTSRFKDLEGMIALNLIFNMWLMAIAGWVS